MAGAAVAEAPRRVVSLNLCTDQLAMALAAPGQLVSVSQLAADPRSSAMADRAQDWPANDGSAEAVVLLEPDLVVAGTFTTRETLLMLERLGYRVEKFGPVNSVAEARDNILRMGALLGQETRAERMVAALDDRLTRLAATPGPAPRVLMYYALGYTTGRDTLPGDLLALAGFDNISSEKGLPFGGVLPLEEVVLSDPDMILIGRPYGGHARATELLDHPVLKQTGALRVIEGGQNWVCEGPALAEAVAALVALRKGWEAGQ